MFVQTCVLFHVVAVLNDSVIRMPFTVEWCRVWIYFGFVFAWTKAARPRFDTSTDMGLVLVPADAEVDSVIFRLRATDQDADFPLVFEITATITPVVRIDNLPCTLYNKVCQANVILTKRLVPGRLHDFAVRVRDTKGDSNSMQATISVTNATTPRDKIFPHIPSLIMVPEDTKPGKELDYLLVKANPWSGKPVYIELWQPKELFTIRQRQTPVQTRGVITLIGELDFEMQSMYTLTMYATDPYTERGKDTRNIAGLSVVVVVQDVQDVPPIFTLAPPLTRINNSVQPGDIILRVHAEDGDKGVPREIVYGLVSEGNPFTPFFNISETSGEIALARPLEELTQITHVGAPVVLTVVAEELRRSREEPPAQATVVDVGFLLGEPGNSPPYFESDNYMATIDENLEPSTVINFGEQYSTRVKDEDIGKAGVFALKLENNNNTFEINPTVAERVADFVITVRDNTLIDYELYKVLSFKITAQEVGPATNLSTSVPVTIFLRDVNDNPPIFEEKSYEVTLSENVTAGSRVVQVHATDKDTGAYGSIRYTNITGEGSEAFTMDHDTGLITVAMGSSLDREIAARLQLLVEARDENGNGNRGVVPLIINLLDVNDNIPMFEKGIYEFMLNSDLTNFTSPVFIKAIDADAEPPNNVVRYELVHGNYDNKFYLNETTGELTLRSPIAKIRRKKQSAHDKLSRGVQKQLVSDRDQIQSNTLETPIDADTNKSAIITRNKSGSKPTKDVIMTTIRKRRKRANDDALYTLTARAYDLGIPHLSSMTQIRILTGIAMEARIMMFVVPGDQSDSKKTAETLAAITGGRVTVLETRPYVQQNHTSSSNASPGGGKKSIIVARVEQTEPGTPLVDVEKIREALAANGVGIINGTDTYGNATMIIESMKPPVDGIPRGTNNNMQTSLINNTVTSVQSEEVTVYKAENKLLLWLLIILGLLMLLAIAILIICCIYPGCPFYMAPRKRRVHSSETLVVRADGRPKRHLHRQPAVPADVSWNGRKQAWSADPARRNWQFNKRNVKNCSLPGDVAYASGQPNDHRTNLEAQRLTEGVPLDHSRRNRMVEQDRLYIEDIEGQKARGYDTVELDSLQRHEIDRGSDTQRHAYRQRYFEPGVNEETSVREQHYYREGNAEVLRLVTRGQAEDASSHPHHHRSTTLIVDGKDIILQRFIEDQTSRHELSAQDIEAARSMESHQRSKEILQQQQPEIILIPEELELRHRHHVEEIGANVQRLVIDHGDYDTQTTAKQSQIRDTVDQDRQEVEVRPRPDGPSVVNREHVQLNNAQYTLHDLELTRQNALLARLLLDRGNKRAGGGGVDSTSYLETQSLPGQVAIATQTDRNAATQTDRLVRSRSDNDESDEESGHRRRLKSRKRHGDTECKRSRTLWMKSPIEEEGGPCFDKRLSILRRKVKEVKEAKRIPLETEVLREISDSLDGNGSSCRLEEDESTRTYRKSTEQTSIRYKILNEKENDSQLSEDPRKRRESSDDVTEDQEANMARSASSPETKIQREPPDREATDGKSPKKEGKSKTRKKTDSAATKPSFRILEKEFTLLTKKLSKLGDKRFRASTGSDTASGHEKSDPLSKETKLDQDQRDPRKPDKSRKQTSEVIAGATRVEQTAKLRKDAAIAKTKQKLKYQQPHVMSTGSSEYDDNLDKPKKVSGARQETTKQQPLGSQTRVKLKRPSQTDRRESRKQTVDSSNEEAAKRKHSPLKRTAKVDSKAERRTTTTHGPKQTVVPRKGNVVEETSTSTESNRDRFDFGGFKKKSSSISSDKDSNKDEERTTKMMQRFSDDFVSEEIETTVGAETIQGAKGARKETITDEEALDTGNMIQTIRNAKQVAKVMIETPLVWWKAEQQPAGIKKTNNKNGVAGPLTEHSEIVDVTRTVEAKWSEDTDATMDGKLEVKSVPSQIESTTETPKEDKLDARLIDTGNVAKSNENENDNMLENKTTMVTDESENKMISAEMAKDGMESCKKGKEDKLSDNTEMYTNVTENETKGREEGVQKCDVEHKDLVEQVTKLFEDQEKQYVFVEKIGDVEVGHTVVPISVKEGKMQALTSDTDGDTTTELDTKTDLKQKEILQLDTTEASTDDKTDLKQNSEIPSEQYATTELSKDDRSSMKEDMTDKLEELKKEEKSYEPEKQNEKRTGHVDTNETAAMKEGKEEMKMLTNADEKEEEVDLKVIDELRKEVNGSRKTDDLFNAQEISHEATKSVENTEKIIDANTADAFLAEAKRTDDKNQQDLAESQTPTKEATSFEHEETSDNQQETSTESAIDVIDRGVINVSEKEKTPDKEAETTTESKIDENQMKETVNVISREKEETMEFTTSKQCSEVERTSPNRETAADKDETVSDTVTIADQKTNKEDSVSFDEKKEKHSIEKEDTVVEIDPLDNRQIIKQDIVSADEVREECREQRKEDYQTMEQQEPCTLEYLDQQKEITIETQMIDHDIIKKEKYDVPESEKVKETKSMVETKDDVSKTIDNREDISTGMLRSDDSIDPGTTERFSKIPHVEKQDIHVGSVSDPPATTTDDTKQETLAEAPLEDAKVSGKKDDSAEMFSDSYSLIHKSTEATISSAEVDAKIGELPSRANHETFDDKSSHDNTDKHDAEAFDTHDFKADIVALKGAEEGETVDKRPDVRSEDETMMPTADEIEVKPMATVKEDTDVSDVLKEQRTRESVRVVELSKGDEEIREKKELVEPSDDKQSLPMKESHERLKANYDESAQKSLKNETASDSGATADKLAPNSERREELHQQPTTSREVESLQGSSSSFTEASKEKFTLETPSDSKETLEPEEQTKLDIEQTEVQEPRSVADPISTKEEDHTRLVREQRLHVERDASMISREEEDKRATSDMDGTLFQEQRKEVVGEQYPDVSLSLFTSIIDTMDDSDDSDSSSDISRKTTLTTRPYHTPRHRARTSSENETARTTGEIEAYDIEREQILLAIELVEDQETERTKEIEVFETTKGVNEGQHSPEEFDDTVINKTEDGGPNEVQDTFASIGTISPGHEKMTSNLEAEEVHTVKRLESKSTSTADEEASTTAWRTKDWRGRESSSTRKHAKTERSIEIDDAKAKVTVKKTMPLREKKKPPAEESSEEKAHHSQDATSQPREGPRKRSTDTDRRKQSSKIDEEQRRRRLAANAKSEKEKRSSNSSEKQIDTSKAQPKYMAWYTKNREEMERRRAELMATDEEDQLPRWLRRSMKTQRSSNADDGRAYGRVAADTTPGSKRRVKPLVNVESEQLKAIVRQGRKLRRAEGGGNEDPPVQIFATTPPATTQTTSKHHLVQHSEYKYEKAPTPFYLHPPPPPPHPSPQLSPQHFDIQSTIEPAHVDSDYDTEIAISLQSGGNRLRHQQLLEKKSVFDIAYNEAAPSQLRSDSTTPPS